MIYEEIIDAIQNGEADEQLDRIINVASRRRQLVREANAAKIEVGSRVGFQNLRPKYLTSLRGELIRIEGDKAIVQLDDIARHDRGYGRYYQDDLEIKVPITTLVDRS